MNFSKNPSNQQQTEKFHKSSALNLQLGLLLALLIVYLGLEFTSTKQIVQLPDYKPDEPRSYVVDAPSKIVIERPTAQQQKKQPQKKELADDFTMTDDPVVLTKPTEFITDEVPPIVIDSIAEIVDKEEPEDDIDFIAVEQAPLFPGCENLNKKEAKFCFTKKMRAFVNKNFNTDLASDNSLSGKQKIYALFTIDKTGNITGVQIRAPHSVLEKETKRVLNKLPKMTPGRQNTIPVSVKYTLPIVFEVH